MLRKIDVQVDQESRTVALTVSREIKVPFSWFEESDGTAPDFTRASIEGRVLRLGDYETDVDRIIKPNIRNPSVLRRLHPTQIISYLKSVLNDVSIEIERPYTLVSGGLDGYNFTIEVPLLKEDGTKYTDYHYRVAELLGEVAEIVGKEMVEVYQEILGC